MCQTWRTPETLDTNCAQWHRVCVYRYGGPQKKSKIKEELERYSIIRTVTAVERADVVLVVIDASEE